MTGAYTAQFSASTAEMQLGQIRAAWPVGAAQIKAAAATANWLLARGKPCVVDGGKWLNSGSTRTFRYFINPDGIHESLICWVSLMGGNVEIPDVDAVTYLNYRGKSVLVNGDSFTAYTPNTVTQSVANILGGTPGAVNVTVEFPTDPLGGTVFISSIQLFEGPLVLLNELGVGCRPPEPKAQVYDGSSERESIAGVQQAYEDSRATYFKRGALFNWSPGQTNSFGETSYTNLFRVNPAIQTRHMYSGETTRNVKVVVWAKVSGGTGNVRITMASGGTVTFNITSTTGAWTTPTNIAVETDDFTRWDTDGGIRGGSRDTVTVEYRAAAAQTITIEGVSIYDEPG